MFAEQTEEQLRINLMTQRIWPYEVYPGYAKKNAERAAKGWSHSTGEGAKSFNVYVQNANPYEMTLIAEYNDYMKYVDIGVGAWGHAEDIDRSKKAKYERRYNKWDTRKRKTHRPAIMMELRHVLRRMRDYAVDFYGYEGLGVVIEALDGVTIDLWDGVFSQNGQK